LLQEIIQFAISVYLDLFSSVVLGFHFIAIFICNQFLVSMISDTLIFFDNPSKNVLVLFFLSSEDNMLHSLLKSISANTNLNSFKKSLLRLVATGFQFHSLLDFTALFFA